MDNLAVLLWGLVTVAVGLLLLRLLHPLVLLGHELGHAIPALILTPSGVDVRLGDVPGKVAEAPDPNAEKAPDSRAAKAPDTGAAVPKIVSAGGGKSLRISGDWRARVATTSYDGSSLGRWGRTGIVLGGPLATLLGLVLGGAAAASGQLHFGLRFLGLVLAWANLRLLIYVLWPGSGDESARGGDARDLADIWSGGAAK